MSDKKIIIDGVDVSKCPHINAYFPDSPKCQQGMGVGGCGSECRGKCSYVDKLKIHNEIQQLKQENEELKETIQELNASIQTCNIERTKLYKKLEEIKEIAKERNYLNFDEALDDILNIISEVKNE